MNKQLLLILMTLLPMVASADAVEIDGIYFNLYKSANTAEVTNNPNIYSGSVVIPEKVNYEGTEYSVTSIGYYAFAGCSGLTSITIPNSVTSIGDDAFYGCSGLTSITIPNSVTSIGYGAFARCSGLTSVTIPNSVTSIGYYAFEGCTAMTSITIPNSVTRIGEYAFMDCSGLVSVAIGNSVTSIDRGTFSGCSGLTSITIPNSVTSIGYGAFARCSGLTSVTISNSVTRIGENAFYECSGLTSITIPNSVTSIGSSAFARCSGLTSVTIPNSVTSIGNYAFSGCSGLTSIKVESGNTRYDSRDNCNAIIKTASNELIVGCKNTTIPNSVTRIGENAFYECSGLTSITIPNSVTSIGSSAFARCSGLTSVTIPNSVTSIGNYAFSGCSGLTSIKVESGNTNYDSRDNCNAIIKTASNELIVGCKNTTIPNSVTRIGENAFYGCTSLTSITIGNSVTSIGENAFYGCTSLTSITIGNSVTSIGEYAFANCRLENILTRSTRTVGKSAFSGQTYQHAMLYIPEGTWSEAVYDSDWYRFNNIRETALKVDDLSPSRVYTLIDTKTFGYAVYDEARGDVATAKAFYSIDEQDMNICWIVTTLGGKKCLYNVGAKKYAIIGADGSIMLTDIATPIEITENENGLLLGTGNSRQWGFVKNNSVTNITGIAPVVSNIGQSADSYYSVDGKQTSSPQKGLNIVRMSDGTTKKVVVK